MNDDIAVAMSLLYKSLNMEYVSKIELWRTSISNDDSVKSIVGLAVDKLIEFGIFNNTMYLHGWIDQAVLEIIDSDLANNLIDKMIVYRPDQGGNSGLLYIDNINLLYVFEISFEIGYANICKYVMI